MRRDLRVLVTPRLLLLHLVGAVAVTAAVLLGLWQLQAWQAQREVAARDLTDLDPVPLEQVLDADEPFPTAAVGRPVEVRGEWLPASTFVTPDRVLGGRRGLWVVTALAVCDEPASCSSSPAVLVVRGWAAGQEAVPDPPSGVGEVRGLLQPPEGAGRPDDDPGDDVLPEVRIADAIQRVDQDLYGAYVVAEATEPEGVTDGLEQVTPESLPSPGSSTGLRNLLYAVQWWLFAAFAGFLWWRWSKDEVERARAGADRGVSPETGPQNATEAAEDP